MRPLVPHILSLRRAPLRSSACIAPLILLVLAAPGCDDARIETAPDDAPPASYHTDALYTLISYDGLESLYEHEFDGGAHLAHRAVDIDLFEEEVTLGPLDASIAPMEWSVTDYRDAFEVDLTGEEVTTTVPVRVGSGADSRLCRYLVEVEQVEATNRLELTTEDNALWLVTQGVPQVGVSGPSVSVIGACDRLDEARGDVSDEEFDQMFVDYLTNAWSVSISEMTQTSLLEALGMFEDPVRVRRLSSFVNRRGAVTFAHQSQADGADEESRGVAFGLDAAARGERAECAPPIEPGDLSSGEAGEVTTSTLDDAHVGIAVAEPLLNRIVGTGALGGFACRGLEDVSFDGEASNLAASDLDLERVDLDQVPGGSSVEPVTRPGSVPELRTSADNNTLRLTFEELSVDLYTEVQGMPTPLATVTARLELALRPRETTDAIELSLDSLEVVDASLSSHWVDEVPDDDQLVRDWTRRLFVLMLDDTLVVPLPLDPASPLHLVDVRVRHADLLLTFDVRR